MSEIITVTTSLDAIRQAITDARAILSRLPEEHAGVVERALTYADIAADGAEHLHNQLGEARTETERLRAVAQDWNSLYSPSDDPEDRWDRGYACAMRDAARVILGEQDGVPTAEEVGQEDAPVYPAHGAEIPGQPGYVVGKCGHRVAKTEWRAGYRVCERCPWPKSVVAGE